MKEENIDDSPWALLIMLGLGILIGISVYRGFFLMNTQIENKTFNCQPYNFTLYPNTIIVFTSNTDCSLKRIPSCASIEDIKINVGDYVETTSEHNEMFARNLSGQVYKIDGVLVHFIDCQGNKYDLNEDWLKKVRT